MKRSSLMCMVGLSAMLGWANPTLAECPSAYTPQQLTADLGSMTSALRSLDEATFRATGAQMEAQLPCIGKKLPTAVYANIYRYIGASHYLNKDYQAAGRWFRTALELDPTYEWDVNDLGPGHPLRGNFDAQRNTAVVDPEPVAGFDLNVPAGSELLLDGRALDEPAATLGRPHLLQVVSTADSSVRQAFIIEGNEIPENFLKTEAAETAVVADAGGRRNRRDQPELGEEVIAGFRVVTVQRVRPPAKTPMMLAGGAGVLIGGGLYAVSYLTQQDFYAATTTDDMLRYQSLTNTLVIASGAVVAVGVGVGYAGVMMDGGPGVVVGGRF